MKIYQNIIELIGRTPLLELKKTEEKYQLKARLVAKLEAFNPAGSVKDRVAYYMIKDALDAGQITSSTEIIEPTSGNTGIGLALVGAALGMKVTIVLPDSMSVERRNLIKAYGARIVLSEGSKGMKGAIEKAIELSKENPDSFIPQQFENMSNRKAHYMTTGPEIWQDTDGTVDILIGGVGTGGTVSGSGRYLKEHKPSVKVVAVEPASSPLLSGGQAGPHKIQGIGANFIPKVYDPEIVDEVLTVTDADAFEYGRNIARLEGVFLGISGGAALKGAIEIARREENKGKTIVVVIPDSGDRYLSTALYNE